VEKIVLQHYADGFFFEKEREQYMMCSFHHIMKNEEKR
jgi:hypothetical protein